MSALILVVIAEPESRANWKQLLEDHGYQTVAIATGERVLDLCAHLRPDMVLMGASLPDGPGREVYRRMKDDPRSRLTPVILIEDFEEDRSSTYKSGHGSTHESGGDDVWGPRPTRWEALTRVQSLIQIKSYIDEQAEAVVLSLAHTIEARDAYTHGHSARLAVSAVELAEKLGLSHDLVETLRIAAIVHDIGKVGVPDSVLLKAGPLSAQEMSIIRRHPVEGERICSPLKSLRRTLPVIRHHHERMDGTGYPDGLRGDAIPLAARILQIVDIYDALTTDRPYRKAYTPTQAIGTLYSEAERGWVDMDLVQVFAPAGAMPKSAISGFTQGAEKMRGIS
jgi:putative two-component system response regulator